jgi:hypothetical protein
MDEVAGSFRKLHDEELHEFGLHKTEITKKKDHWHGWERIY